MHPLVFSICIHLCLAYAPLVFSICIHLCLVDISVEGCVGMAGCHTLLLFHSFRFICKPLPMLLVEQRCQTLVHHSVVGVEALSFLVA